MAQQSDAWRAFADAVGEVKDGKGSRAEQKARIDVALAALSKLTPEERQLEACERLVLSVAGRANWIGEWDLAWELMSEIERRLATAGTEAEFRRQYCSFNMGQVCLNRGDLEQARTRLAAAEPVLARTYRPGDRNLIILRHDLATVHMELRDYATAVSLYEQIVDATRDRADLELVESLSRLGRARHFAGDRMGAFSAYEERLELALRLLPSDDLKVALARQNFGTAMMNLGDYRGSYEQYQKSIEIRSKVLPPDDPDLVGNLVGQSKLLLQLEEDARSKAVILDVIARLHSVEKPVTRHQELLAEAREHLAQLLNSEEDYEASSREAGAALEYYAATRKNGARDVGKCRLLLGANAEGLGRIDAARELLEQALAELSEALPIEDNHVQIACSELIRVYRRSGANDRAVEVAERLIRAAVKSIEDAKLAARPLAKLARIQYMGVQHCLNLALDLPEGETRARLIGEVLFVSQMMRGIETRVARAASRVRREHRGETQRVETELIEISGRIQAISQGGTSVDERQRSALDELVRSKERLQGQLVAIAQSAAPLRVPSVADIVAALPPATAAVATIPFYREKFDAVAGTTDAQQCLAAVVLRSGRPIRLVDMGSYQRLADLVDDDDTELTVLRAALLDPFLGALDGCSAAFLATDELLKIVALDGLPLASGEPVGTTIELRQVESLFDLTETWPALEAAGASLVAVGALDYQAIEPGAEAAVALAVGPPPADLLRGREGTFAALPATAKEVEEIAAAFTARFPGGRVTRLTGRGATKPVLRDALRGARFVHFATHGFGSDVRPVKDATQPAAAVVDLSAFALCGVALSGANLPPDAAGHLPGILLGEELLQFDLTDCHLAVLSVCDSATGALSYGQGFASLHRALHAAGARFVVSTRWPVGDAAASYLMREFYRELLRDPMHPHRALWAAKMRARANGLMDRDWAAFTLTGC